MRCLLLREHRPAASATVADSSQSTAGGHRRPAATAGLIFAAPPRGTGAHPDRSPTRIAVGSRFAVPLIRHRGVAFPFVCRDVGVLHFPVVLLLPPRAAR